MAVKEKQEGVEEKEEKKTARNGEGKGSEKLRKGKIKKEGEQRKRSRR